MSEEKEQEITFRRILVAIDISSHSNAALEAAAELAKTMEARIHGLFVQDEIWNHIINISTSETVNEITGSIRPMGKDSMQEHIDVMKKRLRRQLKTISRENKIKHSWETVKGKVEEKVLEASEDSDLITIGRRGSSFPRKQKLGSSARKIIENAPKPVLILQQGLRLGKKIAILYDGTAESRRGLQLALLLARKNESEVVIMAADNDSEAAGDRSAELETKVEKTQVRTKVKLMRGTDLQKFLTTIHDFKPGLIIIPKNQPLIKTSIETILNNTSCPLLLFT